METIVIGGVELRFLFDKDSTGGSLDLFELTLQPKARMPVPHYHESWAETVYGLSGVATFTIAGQAVPIGPGQSAFIRRGVVHGFDNLGEVPARCLSVLSPGVLGPAYFRELAALVAAGPPDEAIVGAIMRRYGLIPAG